MASACFAKTQWHRNASIGHQTKVTRNLVLVGSRSFFWVYAVVSRWALGSGVLRITGSITTVQIGSLNYQGNTSLFPYVTDFHSPKVFSQPILLNHYRIFVHFSIFFHRFESTSLPHPDSKFQRYPRWAMEHRPCGLYRWCFLGADSGCFLRACRGDNGAKISTIFHGSLQWFTMTRHLKLSILPSDYLR